MASSTASQYQIEKSDLEARAKFFASELVRIQARLAEVNTLLGAIASSAVTPAATPTPVKERKKPGRKPKVAAAPAPVAAPVVAAAPAVADAPKRRGRPPGSKNKPKDTVAAATPAPVKERKKPGRKPKAVTTAPAPKAPAAAPAAEAAPARRGRRSAVSAASIHNLGIVEAAVALAKAKGVRKADAGDVLDWFKEANYKTRNGLPSRNSVYVSLNRESTEGGKKGKAKVTRTDRGAFEFDID